MKQQCLRGQVKGLLLQNAVRGCGAKLKGREILFSATHVEETLPRHIQPGMGRGCKVKLGVNLYFVNNSQGRRGESRI